MGWGGRRQGAGRKPKPVANDNEPAASPAAVPRQTMFSDGAVEMILATFRENMDRSRNRARTDEWNPYIIRPDRFGVIAAHVKKHRPQIAMDNNAALMGQNGIAVQAWQTGGILSNAVSEGLLFLGYPYLAELSQRPEFRLIAEIRAEEMTRKWTKFRGVKDESVKENGKESGKENRDDEERTGARAESGEKPRSDARNKEIEEKIKELDDFSSELHVKDWFKAAAAQNDFFGLSHLLLDLKGTDVENPNDPELKVDIGNGRDRKTKAKFGGVKNFLKGLRTIEPVWVYPMAYNAVNPLAPTWYEPQNWYVMGTEVHRSQLLQFIAHPVADILKPAYLFGGISMTQMAQPYVMNWLQTRTSVNQMIHAFSVMAFGTNMATRTMPGGSGGGAGDALARAAMFNMFRDNMGLWVYDKNTEDFKNVSAPLGGLPDLQAQSQEHMCLQAGSKITTARGQVPIERVTLADLVLTRAGFRHIKWVGVTGFADTLVEIEAGDSVLRTTKEHPIWVESINAFVNARNVLRSHCLLALNSREDMDHLLRGAVDGGGERSRVTTAIKRLAASCIVEFGIRIEDRFRRVMKSITKTETVDIINWIISSFLPALSTWPVTAVSAAHSFASTRNAANAAINHSRQHGNELAIARKHVKHEHASFGTDGSPIGSIPNDASTAEKNIRLNDSVFQNSVLLHACSVPVTRASIVKVSRQPVYDIEVDGPPEFFANGILVHNSSITRIPLVKLTGIQPMGLNATSEGELRAFEETVAGMQEHLYRERLTQVYDLMQYSLWGERDPDITWDFLPLREETPMEKADMRKKEAETDQIRIDSGVVSQEEARQKLASDPDSGYESIDPDDVPDLLEEEEGGLIPEGAGKGLEAELEQEAVPANQNAGPKKRAKSAGADDAPSLSKEEAGYVFPWDTAATQCRACSMFVTGGSCTLVKGEIKARGHCEHFDAKKGKDDSPSRKDARRQAVVTGGGKATDGARQRVRDK